MLNKKFILAMTILCNCLLAPVAQAENVTLRSLDGSTAIIGTLIGFDGDIYQVETSIGTLSLNVAEVTCEGAECPELVADLNEFVIAGSNSIGAQMMPAMIEAYALGLGGDLRVETTTPEQVKYTITDGTGGVYAVITVNLGDSSDAFAALESREAAIGLSSRRATTGERDRFLRVGRGDLTNAAQERILALDGLIVVVSPENRIRSLSLDQISDIFAGNIRNWRDVGGVDAPIKLYRRDGNAGATRVFESLVMAPATRVLVNSAFIKGNNAAVADAVAQDRNGIGITSASENRNAKTLFLRSACGQVFNPSEFLIKTEDYPMSRRLFLYTTSGSIPTKAQEFIDFLTSDAGQGIVDQTGFVSQKVSMASLNDQGRRLAHALISERDRTSLEQLQEMVSGLLEAERLSLTFRFESGSDAPDNRALVDIARLATMLRNGDFEGKHLLIIGFADSQSVINDHQRLSQARAEYIRDVLVEAVGVEAGNVQITPVGYGKISPLACNETEAGRDTNRRVEIWVR